MWNYEKRLQYPVNITQPNAQIAQVIMSQYGGPDGEMGASMRYLSQRFAMPNRQAMGMLTDIGTEELAHLEIVATIVTQLTRNLSMEEIKNTASTNIMLTTRSVSGRRRPAVFRSTPANSSPRATQSLIYLKIWPPNRKPGPPTITFSAL